MNQFVQNWNMVETEMLKVQVIRLWMVLEFQQNILWEIRSHLEKSTEF
jgi:hypothetical protein